MLTAILRESPDWDALPAGTPEGVRRALRRCLVRDARQRYHDIADVRIELEEALEAPEADNDGVASASAAPPTGSARGYLAVAAVAILVLVLQYVLMREPGDSTTDAPLPRHLSIPLTEGISFFDEPWSGGLAVSPDGRRIAFLGTEGDDGVPSIYVRELDSVEPQIVAGTEGATDVAFSPDGRQLLFSTPTEAGSDDLALRRTPIEDPQPVTLVPSLPGPIIARWDVEDTLLLVYADYGRVATLPAEGGEVRDLLSGTVVTAGYYEPQLLPDRRHVILSRAEEHNGGLDVKSLILDIETGETRDLMPNSLFARYVETGHLIFCRDNAILAAPFELGSLEATGAAFVVAPKLRVSSSLPKFGTTRDGSLFFTHGPGDVRNRELVLVDRDGNIDPIGAPSMWFHGEPQLSPDEQRVAVTVINAQRGLELWVYDRDSRRAAELPGPGLAPRWLPGGERIVYGGLGEPGETRICVRRADGSDTETEIDSSRKDKLATAPKAVSTDGRVVLSHKFDKVARESAIWMLPIDPDTGPAPRKLPGNVDSIGNYSPDGNWFCHSATDAPKSTCARPGTSNAAGARPSKAASTRASARTAARSTTSTPTRTSAR